MHSDQMSQSDTSTSSGIRIQYVSDLHLEFPQNRQWIEKHPLEVTGDILLIAGDTAYLDLPDSKNDTYSTYQFWDWASNHYNQVIMCLGNHDFYGYCDLHAMPNGFCKQIRHNIHAYYNSVVHLDGIDIIVSTLWSKIEPYDAFLTERNVSDFYRIMYPHNYARQQNFRTAPSMVPSRLSWPRLFPITALITGFMDIRIATSKHK